MCVYWRAQRCTWSAAVGQPVAGQAVTHPQQWRQGQPQQLCTFLSSTMWHQASASPGSFPVGASLVSSVSCQHDTWHLPNELS